MDLKSSFNMKNNYDKIKISVILPTFNRGMILVNSLDHLIQQEYHKDNYEILVVDNNSSDNTKELVNALINKYPHNNISYLLEKKPGLVYARHTGAKNAKNPILAFIDDDGLVNSKW
jgi:glycosyltransferase involved in cell wall biosynthesis